jgi:hypothetical protein
MTTPEPMTVEDVTRLLHAAVEAYGPDWVDPNSDGGMCKNTYDFGGDTCHCIVGWVLTNHGYEITDNYGGVYDVREALIREHKHAVMDDEAYTILFNCQRQQDRGTPWGEVVTKSLATHTLHTQKNPAKSEETNTDL